MKGISQFKFKRFSVWHHRSALKVGVDGVLIACWADVRDARRILDVGTGCGVIALIMAQRQDDAEVYGIDIDLPSVEEAKENICASPWKDRMKIVHGSFPDGLATNKTDDIKFDLIVSNPPFFDSGLANAATSREKARHQGSLSPFSLIEDSSELLTPGGSLALIAPSEFSEKLKNHASASGYTLAKECIVRGHAEAPYKRVLLQWILRTDAGRPNDAEFTELTLETTPGNPTEDYRNLCKDFYLKF